MRPTSGSSASEKVKSRLVLKALLFILSGTSLDISTAAVPIRLFLWGGAPLMSFETYQI